MDSYGYMMYFPESRFPSSSPLRQTLVERTLIMLPSPASLQKISALSKETEEHHAPSRDDEAKWQADAQLLMDIRQGRANGLALLHARFSKQVNGLVWRTLMSRDSHDDVVQDVFVAIFQNIAKVNKPRALEGWVIQVTLNRVRSHIRDQAKRRARTVIGVPDTADLSKENHEARRMLQRCCQIIDRFPKKEAQAFILCRINGYELSEAADLCNCALSTLKRWLSQADRRFSRRAQSDPLLADRINGLAPAAKDQGHA